MKSSLAVEGGSPVLTIVSPASTQHRAMNIVDAEHKNKHTYTHKIKQNLLEKRKKIN